MKPIPRIEIIKHKHFTGRKAEQNYLRHGLAYCEDYEVRVLRPNRPLQSRDSLTRQSAQAFARQQVNVLRNEGYEMVNFDGRIIRF